MFFLCIFVKAAINLSASNSELGKAMRPAAPWSAKLIKTVSLEVDSKTLPLPPVVFSPVMTLTKFSGVTSSPL